MPDHLPDCLYAPNQPAFIRPCAPTPTHTLYLSNLDDQSFLRFTIKYLYVFRSSVAAHDLKAALSRALIHYYPLAGRLRRCRDVGADGKLEIDCNGDGAVFAEAEMDLSADEFLQFAVKPNRSLRKLLYSVDGAGFLEIPPLVIQVTNLRCGGMILCTAINHCFCDGIGTSQFLHVWAHMTRHRSAASPPFQPFHSRHVLKPRSPPEVTCSHPGFIDMDPNAAQASPNIYRFLQSQPSVPASITFSRPQILHLKSQCLPSLKCSTFEVLACHTWRCWVKSLDLPLAMTVKLLFSVNVRNKLFDQMPAGYYANGFVLACAEAQVKELVAAPGLHDGVKLVQQAKSTVSDEYVRSMVDLMEDKAMRVDLSASLVISQWSRLGLQELDFGQGKPLHMGPLSSSIHCLFLPVVGESDAVRVLVSMPGSVAEKFELYMRDFSGVLEHGDGMNQYGVESMELVPV